jgi:hypothetical protein
MEAVVEVEVLEVGAESGGVALKQLSKICCFLLKVNT